MVWWSRTLLCRATGIQILTGVFASFVTLSQLIYLANVYFLLCESDFETLYEGSVVVIKWDNVHDAVRIMPATYEFLINMIVINSISIAERLRVQIQNQISGFKVYIYYLQAEHLLQIT